MEATEVLSVIYCAKAFNQRIGQFLENAAVTAGKDLFYLSDKELVEVCMAYYEKYGNKYEAR